MYVKVDMHINSIYSRFELRSYNIGPLSVATHNVIGNGPRVPGHIQHDCTVAHRQRQHKWTLVPQSDLSTVTEPAGRCQSSVTGCLLSVL